VHPDDREPVEETVRRALADASPFDFEHRVPLTDGRVRWIASRGRVITDEGGAPVRMVGTAQEIVDNLNEQALKLDRLLSDLLDLDRLRHGFVRPSFRPTDIGRLASRVAAERASDLHAIQLEAVTAMAEVDAQKVERIVENLLANALIHTPPGTEVCVRVQPSDTGVLIAVDDRGPGVTEEEREAIFEIFHRGTAVEGVRGTGIGLSLVSQFTALPGGRAWVEENEGGGSSFRVFLLLNAPISRRQLMIGGGWPCFPSSA
jgi:signal transduction histidine kinase